MKKTKIIIILIVIILIITITVPFIMYKKQIKIKEDLEYEKSIEGMRVTLIGGTNMKDKGNVNSNSYIIRTKNNEVIVVDGGRDLDATFLYDYIMKYGNGKVNHWYITHAHEDHVGALLEILNGENNVEIENTYYYFNELQWYEKYDTRGYPTEKAMIEALNNPKIKNAVECFEGQKIQMDNIQADIIRIANPEIIHSDNGNDSSMVFKLTAMDVNKSMIFLGDSYVYTSKELLENPEVLESYAVQMSHHGQNGVSKEVYDAINPKVCFWNAPEYLYNNDNGSGYNTGKWQSIIVREWMAEKGASNILAFEGDQTIHFTKSGFEKIEN